MNKIIAITGPSGAGKTTLGNMLKERLHYCIPRHCTTRSKRSDDVDNFYRFLSHEEFSNKKYNNEFIIFSGDGPEIKKEYGNFYGILKQDCIESYKENDTIVIFVSYKDLDQIKKLNGEEFDIKLVNLTFKNIEDGILSRITNTSERNHSKQDILNRIKSANELENEYGIKLREFATSTIYTDELDIEQMYTKVCNDLGIFKDFIK